MFMFNRNSLILQEQNHLQTLVPGTVSKRYNIETLNKSSRYVKTGNFININNQIFSIVHNLCNALNNPSHYVTSSICIQNYLWIS
jgi:hypothetical protein